MKLVTETFLPTSTTEPMQVILPYGLIGLGELRAFDLTPLAESWPFIAFRSQGKLELEFLVVEARNVLDDYVLELSEDDAEDLGLDCADDALVLNIVTVHSMNPQYVTVNLAGPVIINRRTLLGKQVIVGSSARFSTSHPLIDERAAQSATNF